MNAQSSVPDGSTVVGMTVVGEEFFQGMTVGVTISSVVDVVVAGVKTMICDIEAVTVSDFIPEWQLRAIGELWDDYLGEWRCGINMAFPASCLRNAIAIPSRLYSACQI